MERIGFVENNFLGSGAKTFRAAKRDLGLHVTLFTRDPGYYEKVSQSGYFLDCVDEVVRCETNDPRDLQSAITAGGASGALNALTTIGDYHTAVTAEVAARLGLPGLDPEAARVAVNKFLTQERCERAGVPVAKRASFGTRAEAAEAVKRVGLPCVVKPVDGTSSKDVLLCWDLEDVEAQLEKVRETPTNERGQPRETRLLAEEYLLGHEVSVEVITFEGRHHPVGVTDKQLSANPYFVETGHSFPSCLPRGLVESCEAVAIRALDAIGFDFGVAHVELKVTEKGPHLIEINPRSAGDRITDLVEQSMGINLLLETLRLHLGRRPDLSASSGLGASIRFLTASPGRITRISGEELASRLPGVTEVFVKPGVGEMVRPLHSSEDRIGHVMVSAGSPYLAARLADSALSQLRISTIPA